MGFIQRGPHGLWHITPIQSGPIGVSAKAKTQKDAICYLAQLLTRPASMTVDGVSSSLRIVGQGRNVFKCMRENVRNPDHDIFGDEEKTYRVDFWDKHHGIETAPEILIESTRNDTPGVTLTDKLSGKVLEVKGHSVVVAGRSVTKIGFP